MGRGKTSGKKIFAKGYNGYKLFWILLLGSLIGDVIETLFCRYKMGMWMSRSSVIYGPFSIVWGLGAVLLTVSLHKLIGRRDLVVFLAGTVVGGAYEYSCSVIQEILFGVSFWDYSKIPFNINGRVNLLYCFFWGLLALVWVKDIYPRLSRWIERIPHKLGVPLTWVLLVFMVGNAAVSAGAIIRMAERNARLEPENKIEIFLDEHYPDERVMKVYPNMKFLDD